MGEETKNVFFQLLKLFTFCCPKASKVYILVGSSDNNNLNTDFRGLFLVYLWTKATFNCKIYWSPKFYKHAISFVD